jgi:methylmalonyl-CoA/ethylmalonyl-CoA epimerase
MSRMPVSHLGFVVPDMAAALRRWTDGGAEIVLGPTDDPIQRVTCCLLRTDGDVDIELVAPIETGDSPVDGRLKRGGGLDHICYLVDSLEDALEQERANGSVVVCEPVYAVTFNRDIAFVHRRTGLVVEYMTTHETGAGG